MLKKKIARGVALFLLPFLGSLVIRLLYALNKKEFHIQSSNNDEPTIFAIWHGELLMLPYLYKQFRKTPHAKVLISDHFDGLLISKTIEYFGLKTIAGSSNRKAVKALLESIKALKEGWDIGITPDGPKGPRHTLSDGVVVMAQKAKIPVVVVEIKPTNFWQLNSWDRFVVPKPFGTIRYYAKKIDISNMTPDEAKMVLSKGLLEHES